jgi:protein involved in sex pheromone biosynthesis
MKRVDTVPQEEKFTEMFDMTLESDHDYFGSLDEINFFGLICKAAQGDYMRKIYNNDIVMFNTEYEDQEAVLIVVQIPVNVNEDDENVKVTKFVSNRVMKMIFLAEKCLVQLDVCETTQESEDKFVYIKMIKKIGG